MFLLHSSCQSVAHSFVSRCCRTYGGREPEEAAKNARSLTFVVVRVCLLLAALSFVNLAAERYVRRSRTMFPTKISRGSSDTLIVRPPWQLRAAIAFVQPLRFWFRTSLCPYLLRLIYLYKSKLSSSRILKALNILYACITITNCCIYKATLCRI